MNEGVYHYNFVLYVHNLRIKDDSNPKPQVGFGCLKWLVVDPQSDIVILSENSHVGARNGNGFYGELGVEEANGGKSGGIPDGHVLVFHGRGDEVRAKRVYGLGRNVRIGSDKCHFAGITVPKADGAIVKGSEN